MRLAVISATRAGALLVEKLAQKLPYDMTVYVKNGREGKNEAQGYQQLSQLVREIFHGYDGLLFIMATGIVVRVIAPLVQDKRSDPAVVTMDELGQFAISLLSGHIGGANELALTVAQAIGAQPVITTATDVNHLPAVDVLAVKLRAKLEPFSSLKSINASIVNGDDVKFFFEERFVQPYREIAEKLGIEIKDLALLDNEDYSAAVLVTDKVLQVDKQHIFVRPPSLVVGVGCRRGIEQQDILRAIEDCCAQAGVSKSSIALLTSTIKKQDEIGLLQAAQSLGVKIVFYANRELSESIKQHHLSVSSFVEQTIGVGNVCEASAMAGPQTKRLIKSRTKYSQITVAIAQVRSGL